jgi:hypothetical protein
LLRFIASKRDHFIKLYEKGDVPTKRYLDEATLKRVLKWLNKLPKVEPLPDDQGRARCWTRIGDPFLSSVELAVKRQQCDLDGRASRVRAMGRAAASGTPAS